MHIFQSGFEHSDEYASLPSGYNVNSSFSRPRPPASSPLSRKGHKASTKAANCASRLRLRYVFSSQAVGVAMKVVVVNAFRQSLRVIQNTERWSHTGSRASSSARRAELSSAAKDSLNKIAKLRSEEEWLREELQAAIVRVSISSEAFSSFGRDPLLTQIFDKLMQTKSDLEDAERVHRTFMVRPAA